jgi:hypothetical protein
LLLSSWWPLLINRVPKLHNNEPAMLIKTPTIHSSMMLAVPVALSRHTRAAKFVDSVK